MGDVAYDDESIDSVDEPFSIVENDDEKVAFEPTNPIVSHDTSVIEQLPAASLDSFQVERQDDLAEGSPAAATRCAERTPSTVKSISSDSHDSLATKPEILALLADQHYDREAHKSLENVMRPVVFELLEQADLSNGASIWAIAVHLQNAYANSETDLHVCLNLATDYFIACDASRQPSTFFVLHDLIQREPKARLPFLQFVFPRLAWHLSGAVGTQRDNYCKAINVWAERQVFPPQLCSELTRAMELQPTMQHSSAELNRRLMSFAEMLDARAAQDEAVELILGETDVQELSIPELQEAASLCHGALDVTKESLLYAMRLCVDFSEAVVKPNEQHQWGICQRLQFATSAEEDTS